MRRSVPKRHRPLSSGVLYHPAKVHFDTMVATASRISGAIGASQARRFRELLRSPIPPWARPEVKP